MLRWYAADGKAVVQEFHEEQRTRTRQVTENGVTKILTEAYLVKAPHYKVIPMSCTVELRFVLPWYGANPPRPAPPLPADLVQKFIDR